MATKELPPPTKSSTGYYRTSWVDADGRKHWKSFGKVRAKALQRFDAFKLRWKSDPTLQGGVDHSKLTIREAWTLFSEWAQGYYRHPDGRPTGEAGNLRDSFAVVLEKFGDEPCKRFTPMHLDRVIATMVERGLAANTINARTRKVRQVFKWLVRKGMVESSVWHGLQTVTAVSSQRGLQVGDKTIVPKTTEPVRPVPDADVWATIKHLPPSVSAMVQIQYWSGCRPQDVCNLRPMDLDTTGKVWIYRPETHKTAHKGKTRTVLLGPQAQAVLAPMLAGVATHARVFTPARAKRERDEAKRSEYNPQGYDYRNWPSYQTRLAKAEARLAAQAVADEWTSNTYARTIARVCRDNNIGHWSPNQLRHNAATRLRQRFGLDVVQVVLGHSHADVTQVYAEADLAKAVEVMESAG